MFTQAYSKSIFDQFYLPKGVGNNVQQSCLRKKGSIRGKFKKLMASTLYEKN